VLRPQLKFSKETLAQRSDDLAQAAARHQVEMPDKRSRARGGGKKQLSRWVGTNFDAMLAAKDANGTY